jgi:photosynthetic reaction center cytochrome c subunit
MKPSLHTAALGGFVLMAGVLLAGCERPPVESEQLGYRGLGMQTVSNPRLASELAAQQTLPAVLPAVPAEGPAASTVYQNVPVLGHLTVPEFTRLMLAITEWVAPKEEACNYCHETDLASDAKYAKVVSRRMLEMVRDLNENWQPHLAQTGVTCYTCHRGAPVPAQIWFKDPGPHVASPISGSRAGQNSPAPAVGLASLPFDAFSGYLDGPEPIRVVSTRALPSGDPGANIKDTESTYGLMMHLSQALGVNCTYCHNSRSFAEWDSSTPARVTAWHGLSMVRHINNNYLEPLTSAFPQERLGPLGDVAKVNCATCHQGVFKPLAGAPMLQDYPELGPPRPVPVAPDAAAEVTAEAAAQ